MITDSMIRKEGINIGFQLMPVTNLRPIPALKKLSKAIELPRVLTLEEAKQKLIDQGLTQANFAMIHGFKPRTVTAVLNGGNKGRYGEAHDVAVALGVKLGVRHV